LASAGPIGDENAAEKSPPSRSLDLVGKQEIDAVANAAGDDRGDEQGR